jgi:hypothetical protein
VLLDYHQGMISLFRNRSTWLLIAIGLLVFGSSVGHDFLYLDDIGHVTGNPHLLNPSASGLWAFWAAPYFGLYMPLINQNL